MNFNWNLFYRPETDIEAQSEINSEARAKPPDYFEDLPPTYEEAMKMKNLEASTSKVILHNYAKFKSKIDCCLVGPYRKIPNCCRSIGWTCDQHCSLWRKSNFIDSIRMVLQRRFGIFDKLFSFAFPIPQTNIMITIKMKIIFKKWKINSKGNWPWCCG